MFGCQPASPTDAAEVAVRPFSSKQLPKWAPETEPGFSKSDWKWDKEAHGKCGSDLSWSGATSLKRNWRISPKTSVIDRIEVDDDAIRVFGRKDVLADAIAGRNSPAGNVSGFVRKWRATRNEDANRFEVLILSHAGPFGRNETKAVDPT